MITIDPKSKEPIYTQIIGAVAHLIVEGALAQDEQLPSVRTLARDLGINPNTVSRAYMDLEAQGIIYQLQGRGSFITGKEAAHSYLNRQLITQLTSLITRAYRAGLGFNEVQSIVDSIYKEGEVK